MSLFDVYTLLHCDTPNHHSTHASSALSLPATLTEDVFLPSRPFSTTGARSLSLASAKHTTHHHVPSYHQFPTQSSLHRPTSVPSIGLTSPHDTPPYSSPTEPDGGHQNPTVIIFATIGGTIGLIFLALFMRQAIAYFRLPRHNAALTAAAREQLEREMAENATRGDQRWSYPAPPPPYERAPSYQSC